MDIEPSVCVDMTETMKTYLTAMMNALIGSEKQSFKTQLRFSFG